MAWEDAGAHGACLACGMLDAVGMCLRRVLTLIAALVTGSPAAEFFVAPDGSDAAAGTRREPFATVQQAQQAAAPGDTVTLRGGRYVMTGAHIARRTRLYAYVIHLDKSGAPGAPITYRAAKGEQPVFDFSAVKPAGLRVAAFHVPASWIHLQGLDVTGVQVTIKRHTQSICFYNNGSHNVYERLTMHDSQAIGVYSVKGGHNLWLNCDAWNNYDYTSEGGRGGNVDGFGCHPEPGASGNIFRGCRAWHNSDDGFDLIGAHEAVTLESCWAYRNGYSADGKRRADGNGFKAGGYGSWRESMLPRTIPRHVIRYCVAAAHPASGFYANHHPGGCDWRHNSAWGNGTSFNFLCRLRDNTTDIPGTGHVIYNNVSADTRRNVSQLADSGNTLAGNLFNFPRRPATADFASTDPAELLRRRKADGSLPAIQFLHPAKHSTLIDAGTPLPDVKFRGKAPDAGAFES